MWSAIATAASSIAGSGGSPCPATGVDSPMPEVPQSASLSATNSLLNMNLDRCERLEFGILVDFWKSYFSRWIWGHPLWFLNWADSSLKVHAEEATKQREEREKQGLVAAAHIPTNPAVARHFEQDILSNASSEPSSKSPSKSTKGRASKRSPSKSTRGRGQARR